MKTKILLICAIAALIMNGCKKDTPAAPVIPAPTKTELLTYKNWKLTHYTVNPAVLYNGVYVTDIYAQMRTCEQDNISSFYPDYDYIDMEGATRCDSAASSIVGTGTWNFNSNETQLIIDGTMTYSIVTLTASTLKITIVESYNGVNYTESLEYSN